MNNNFAAEVYICDVEKGYIISIAFTPKGIQSTSFACRNFHPTCTCACIAMAVASGPAGPVLAGPVFAIVYTFSGLRMRKSIRLRT